MRLRFQADAEFVIGDPTEMPRPQAYKTDYVGKLSDGDTRGFWLLVSATPFRGRAIPGSLLSDSSRTIAQGAGQKEVYHQIRYKNQATVNVIGVWRTGMAEPLWVMSNLAPQEALRTYHARTRIDD